MATNKISHRVDTAAAWTSANPTLELGELGFESDAGNWKRGDGSTTWNSLGYATGRAAVGTVSQSGGTPTGAVIERVSNANGEGVKFADGTYIAWADKEEASVDIDTADNAVGYLSVKFTYDVPISSTTVAAAIAARTSGGSFIVRSAGPRDGTSTSSSLVFLASAVSQTGIAASLRIVWVGRWF